MGRLILFAATLFLLAAPASAQQQDDRILKGVVDWSSRVEHRDDGLSILTYDLSESSSKPRGRKVFSYIVYTSIDPPSRFVGIDTFHLSPPEFSRNYYTLAVANLGTRNAIGTVTLKLTGPTRWTRKFKNVSVPGPGGAVFYYQGQPLNRIGNYLIKGSFTGAGSMKSRFCAGCVR